MWTMKARQFSSGSSYQHHKQNLEFKYLYFRIQKLINKKVILSLKYEQLKTPEIHSTLIKPITDTIIKISDHKLLVSKLNRYDNPRYGEEQKLSSNVIFILLLLRHEYLIQSENNLILFDLLNTKANLCELLAVRMLREYKSYGRISLLFVKPLKSQTFNTLELAVLSNSKKFLSQPIIVRILDRFYNGELVRDTYNQSKEDDEQGLVSHEISNYRFNKISFKNTIYRSNTVPKYQSLVINLKLMIFLTMYFIIILNKKSNKFSYYSHLVIETIFWLMGLNMNVEFLMKATNVEMRFFRMIIWNHIDFILICLIDTSFILKVANSKYYPDLFSLISIILLPRILSILNNYRFFNLIFVSFYRMMWNLMGLLCFFTSLISGFYFTFVSLSKDRSNYEIMFDMVKIFFGFTPSVWNNWENYNTLGNTIQMAYLFLIQFFIGTVMAIVLSGVFSKVNNQNQEEFDYFKATNLILYFKSAQMNNNNSISAKAMNLLRLPIIVLIFIYELIMSQFYSPKTESPNDLKFFTFLSREDYDQDVVDLMTEEGEGDSLMISKSRNVSLFRQPYGRRYSQIKATPALNQVQSISTLGGNFRSASTDSQFIDEILNKKYGKKSIALEKVKTNNSEIRFLNSPVNRAFVKPNNKKTRSHEILLKLRNLEDMLVKHHETATTTAIEESDSDDTESVILRPNINDPIYNIAEAALDDIDSISSEIDYFEDEIKPEMMVQEEGAEGDNEEEEDDDVDTLSEVVYESDDTF
ncbi:uncharacterized protein RJT20DRAFT_6964 [Scheffersomyces xylosifermentans]|uniref:uncharacterized protein n=1 Tax=Scheffersomyces xylosifermentans TaxID=1304137 RepID=UPI00315D2233